MKEQNDTLKIRIALPSKGRMEGETMRFLEACGLTVNKTNPRQYTASVPTIPEVQVLFQRSRDIPQSVRAGDVDLGITGIDLLADAIVDSADEVLIIHDALGYGGCSLVLAVPDRWGEVNSVDELRIYTEKHESLRAATKHPNLVRQFFADHDINGCQIVVADGALEATPSIGSADFIVDITSTGTTLRDNQMKQIVGGTLIESQACFIGNLNALRSRSDVLGVTIRLLELFEANLRAKGQHMIWANVRGESAESVAERVFTQSDLGGLQGPTIAPIYTRDNESWFSINIVASNDNLYSMIEQIRVIGGSGVVVTPITYIFEKRPVRYQALMQAASQGEA